MITKAQTIYYLVTVESENNTRLKCNVHNSVNQVHLQNI